MINPHRRQVVVGVNGSDGSLAAVDLAAAEARLHGARLLLLSANPRRQGPRTTLTAILRRTCTIWPGMTITARNVTGDPAGTLLAASRTAAMVVVGRRGHDSGWRSDSVSAQVAAHSLCPTLVVPADSDISPGRPVLVGLGLTADDEPAIAFGFEEASRRRTGLLAVHVWSGVPGTAMGQVDPFAYDLAQAQAAADRLVAEALAGWSDKYPDVTVERMPLYDPNRARTLLDASNLASLVVVGARRHGRRSSQLLGTVTRALVEHAPCPVAVIRPGYHG